MYKIHTICLFISYMILGLFSIAGICLFFIKTHLSRLYSSYSSNLSLMFSFVLYSIPKNNSCGMISSTAWWTTSLFPCSFPNLYFNTGPFLYSLKFPTLVYLNPKSSKTLHSSDECPGPWIIQVSFDWSLRWYTYLCLRFLVFLVIS